MSKVGERLANITRPVGDEEVLKVAYPSPRFEVSTKALVGAGVVALVGVLLFAAVVLTRPSQGPAPAPLPAVSTSEASATPSAPSGDIVVSVVGHVPNPGLFTLPAGARVADALAEAGADMGLAGSAGVNLAEKLTDGVQIQVPAPGETVAQAPAATATDGRVNLNSASAADLEALSGVGAKTAQAIIAHRDAIGSFSSVEQLMEVKGIGPAKFADLKDQVTV